jgi:flagellar protein FlgJ
MPPIYPQTLPLTPQGAAQSISAERARVLMEKSQELEAAFLSEMMSFAGLGETEGSFTGGAGEEQFASFLRAEQANLMVARGGIGLAEQIFQSLMAQQAQDLPQNG